MNKGIYILAILLLLPACVKEEEDNPSDAGIQLEKECNPAADNLALKWAWNWNFDGSSMYWNACETLIRKLA